MQARLEPEEYTAWFRSELGQRVWKDAEAGARRGSGR